MFEPLSILRLTLFHLWQSRVINTNLLVTEQGHQHKFISGDKRLKVRW